MRTARVYYYLVSSSLFPRNKHDPKRPKYKGPFTMDYRERRSHARGVHLTQDTTRMGAARMKEEKEADTKVIVRE